MQIILSRVAKLRTSTGVGLMNDEKVQVRTSNKISGEPGSIGMVSLEFMADESVTQNSSRASKIMSRVYSLLSSFMIKLIWYGLSELLGWSGEHLFRRLHGLNIGLHCLKGINQRVDLEIQKRPNW